MPQHDDDKPVGYGSPPVYSRFTPGTSGNPSGRPKGKPRARKLMTSLLQIDDISASGEGDCDHRWT
jgi:hypothetical protein